MALITLQEFKDVLGIGDIYPDAIVQEVANAAQNIILSYLTFDKVSIASVKLVNNVATFYAENNTFVTGQALKVTGCLAPFDGSRTVVDYRENFFTVAITNADVIERQLIPRGSALLISQANAYDTTPEVREAALAVGVDIWITRTGTLGQQGVDFQSPAPYRLGRSMLTRVSGLLGKHLDVRGYLG
jgi:hypothetical protein